MRGFKFAYLGFTALVTTIGATSSCTGPSDDCETHRSCSGGTSASGSGGDAGEGNSGTSGASGKGGAGTSGSTSGGKSGMSGSSGSGGAGESGAGAAGGSCDTTKSPGVESCLVSDGYAVFVSPSGDDDKNDGSQAAPLASLTKAVEVAAGAKLILVCDATYDEHVLVGAGARIYGGFKCTDWTTEDAKPVFKPTTPGPALKIDSVNDEVVVNGLSFEVGNASAAGETALTAIVNQSPKVTLRGSSLKAGKGMAGANGTLAMFDPPAPSTLDGNPESPVTMGGGEKDCPCQSGLMSIGGAGGPPSSTGQAGAKGGPSHGPSGGEAGDPTAGDCGSGSSGKKGANAPAAGPTNGATTLGLASVSGWQPAAGMDGATGAPGQGGGGGASLSLAGHGGGGGCGGCGGNGGTAGKGGGGSIALLALGAPVIIEACVLAAADAGNGGSGVAGQKGQKTAGSGGNAIKTINSCGGGAGGQGGDGGDGGGGAGGISVGIVWKGAMAPTVSVDTTTTTGKAGMKGAGGVPVTNDGIAGVAQKILSLN